MARRRRTSPRCGLGVAGPGIAPIGRGRCRVSVDHGVAAFRGWLPLNQCASKAHWSRRPQPHARPRQDDGKGKKDGFGGGGGGFGGGGGGGGLRFPKVPGVKVGGGHGGHGSRGNGDDQQNTDNASGGAASGGGARGGGNRGSGGGGGGGGPGDAEEQAAAAVTMTGAGAAAATLAAGGASARHHHHGGGAAGGGDSHSHPPDHPYSIVGPVEHPYERMSSQRAQHEGAQHPYGAAFAQDGQSGAGVRESGGPAGHPYEAVMQHPPEAPFQAITPPHAPPHMDAGGGDAVLTIGPGRDQVGCTGGGGVRGESEKRAEGPKEGEGRGRAGQAEGVVAQGCAGHPRLLLALSCFPPTHATHIFCTAAPAPLALLSLPQL
jgi:hypothetical protein